MATRDEVLRKLEALIARLASNERGRRRLAEALPESRTLLVRVPDIDTTFWSVLAAGTMGEVREGDPGEADIRVTAPSDTLIELLDGKGSLFSAYLAGRVRVDASMSDLLRLRKLL